ncbi:MAG: ribosomal protein S18-alanine N-acetyltransferase [Candidatus Cloacimonetes bacterium]|nr:ribosomal protein S18-alanine N-acetyltransferase [Candidatus Cloacimonadota bacterium]
MKPEVSRMQAEQVDLILDLEKCLFSEPWTREMFLQEMTQHDAFVLRNSENGEILGYICGWKILEEYHITNLGVNPGYQRQGWGEYLVRYLMKIKSAEQHREFYLEVRKSNIPALSLYGKIGFKIIGARRNYYNEPKEDAILMHCLLEEG